jgi:hypothetical protein
VNVSLILCPNAQCTFGFGLETEGGTSVSSNSTYLCDRSSIMVVVLSAHNAASVLRDMNGITRRNDWALGAGSHDCSSPLSGRYRVRVM